MEVNESCGGCPVSCKTGICHEEVNADDEKETFRYWVGELWGRGLDLGTAPSWLIEGLVESFNREGRVGKFADAVENERISWHQQMIRDHYKSKKDRK